MVRAIGRNGMLPTKWTVMKYGVAAGAIERQRRPAVSAMAL